MKISVCIPTYNGARYLRACLDSVLTQTYKEIEILVVDDGSTDSTLAILDSYATNDKRIRVIRNDKNIGLVGNWNRCIKLAQGEWIKFLFQDDLLETNCLENMLTTMRDGDLFIACGRKFEFEPQTTPEIKKFYLDNKLLIENLYATKAKLSGKEFADIAVNLIGCNLVGEPTVTLIHRSVFENFGDFNNRLIMSCDLEYWTRVAIHTGIRFVPDELAVFRVHGQATSAENRRDRQYRMNVLDNLALWHDVATHPLYEPLRAAASRRIPSLNLMKSMKHKAHIARAIAENFGQRKEFSKGTLLTEWKDFVSLYPRLQVGWLDHFIWRARNPSEYKKAQRICSFS